MALCALTMLDGMGDELTAAGGVVILVLAMVLAWLSTHVADRGDHILGTILTVGAHASLIGLGGHDGYSSGGPASSDAPEQQTPPASQENKPEEEGGTAEAESGSEAGEGAGDGGGGGGAADVGADRLMDIQSKAQHACTQHSHDEEEEEDEEEDEEGDEEDDDVEADDEEEEEEEVGEEEEKKTAAKLSSAFPDSTTTTPTGAISVRLKFLNDTEEVAVVTPQETVGLLKSKFFSGREQQVKLIYQGQLLHDPKRTLSSLNITHNSVIHCHICQLLVAAAAVPEVEESSPPPPGGGGVRWGVSGGVRAAGVALSTSSLVVPVFVVILAVVWYFRINYRQFFTAPATISLVGVTVFFSFLVFGMHGR